jgi:hypothetical protein
VSNKSALQGQKKLTGDHPDVLLAELLSQQHGVVSRRHLRAIGMSDKAVRHRVAVKRLRRVGPSVYTADHRLTPRGRCLAAVLGCGKGALASHWWSAALLDLRRWPTGRIDVTVPRLCARSPADVRIHLTRALAPHDRIVIDGIPCTPVARTLVDLAAVATPVELERLVDQSVRLNLLDRNAIERHAGRPGIARLRKLVADLPDEAPPVNLELERRFLSIVRKAGLPLPVVNGYIGEHQVDFHWPAQKLAVETDGRASHANAVAFERDRRRDLDLESAGWHVLRFSWRQIVNQPERLVALLRIQLIRAVT